jgi:hypothetical protein
MKPKHMTAPRPCAAARQRPNWVLSERMVKRKPLIHMTLAVLLLGVAVFSPSAAAWRLGNQETRGVGFAGGRPELRGNAARSRNTMGFQLFPSAAINNPATIRRPGVSHAPLRRLKLAQHGRTGRSRAAPMQLGGVRMAQQPSSPASKSEGITLEAAYGSLASGQIGSMEELDTLFEATKLPQHPRNALSRQP